MLNLMRENAGSWIIKILLGIIVLVFIFLGIGPNSNKNANEAAVVNDKVITMDQYRIAYKNIVENYRRQFGQRFDDKMIEMFGIKRNALDALIENELVNQEADRLGITVAAAEIQAYIKELPYFRTDDKFDFEKYDRILRSSGQTPDYFESQIKREIIGNKIRQIVGAASNVTDLEISERYLWKNAEMNIEYVLIDSEKFKDITLSDEEINDYYVQNNAQYMLDEQVAVKYLKFSPDAYKTMVTVSDEEIARYYNDYQDKFSVPEKVKASHILIKTEEDSTPEAIETAKQKAMDVYRKAAGGEDFAELAKQFSEGPSAATGGDLGTFEKGQMVKPFSDKAFSMKQGEIGEPVKTRFGWHVIKVDEKFEAATKSLVEATPEIKEIKAKEKAENLAFENSDVAFEDIINGAELDQAATNMGVKVLSTNFFTKVPGPPEIPAKFRNEFSEAAFKLAEKGVSDVLDFDGDYYIIQADRIKKPYVPDLKDVKDRVTESALAAARDEKALKEAETLLAELKPGKDFPEGQASETGFFKRDNTGTDIKVDRTLIGEAFKLSDANRCPETPVKGNKGYYVLRLKEKKKGDLSLLDKEKDSIREALVSEKKSSEYQSWLNLLKQNSTITENQNLL